MTMRIESVSIDQINLDIDNPRWISNKGKDVGQLSHDETQKILIMRMIVNYDVGGMIDKILKNIDVSKNMLHHERIILQDDKNQPDKYVVKEGNRRITALKLILNSSVLDGIDINNVILSANEKKKYTEFVSKYKKRLGDLGDNEKIEAIEANIYDNSERSTKEITEIIRNIHKVGKKPWSSVDKMITNFNRVDQLVSKGKSLDEAICEIISHDFEESDSILAKNFKKELNSEYPRVKFFMYLVKRIEEEKIRKDGFTGADIKEKLISSFLPVCEVLQKSLEKKYGIKSERDENEILRFHQDKSKGNCEEQFLEISPIREFIDEVVIHTLLSKKKPLANYNLKSNGIEKNFGDIAKKFSVDGSELTVETGEYMKEACSDKGEENSLKSSGKDSEAKKTILASEKNEKLFVSIAKKNNKLQILQQHDAFENELNRLGNLSGLKYTKLALYRGFWEASIRSLRRSGFDFGGTKDMTESVRKVCIEIDKEESYLPLGDFYGLSKDEVLKYLVNVGDKKVNFFECYKCMHDYAHQNFESGDRDSLFDFARDRSTRWLMLTNYLLVTLSKGNK